MHTTTSQRTLPPLPGGVRPIDATVVARRRAHYLQNARTYASLMLKAEARGKALKGGYTAEEYREKAAVVEQLAALPDSVLWAWSEASIIPPGFKRGPAGLLPVGTIQTPNLVKLTAGGLDRVLEGQAGMVFIVDATTETPTGLVVHVRDYRYPQIGGKGWQVWSIGPEGYDV